MNTTADIPVLKARLRVRRPGFDLDVDLALPGRGVSVLHGPSGSGKTTCLRLIAGLERAPDCAVSLGDTVWQGETVFTPVHRRDIGYVFQEANLFPHLSVSLNLEYGRKRRDRAGLVDFDHLVGLLGIGHLLARAPATLSGGERQRVAIARALLSAPRLLLMDEPLAALDARRKDEILPYLDRLHAELDVPVVYVSHSGNEVARLADHLVLLDQGRVIAEGPATTLLSRLDLPENLLDEAGTILDGQVTHHDSAYGLARLAFPGGEINFVHPDARHGQPLRVQIKERDISLALDRPAATSIQNLLPVTITSLADSANPAHVRVQIDTGGTLMVACITRQSRDRLGLRVGMRLWAQIKSVAVLG